MFDIGWQELFIIAVLTLIVVGPKDLPRVLKVVIQGIRKVKGMAREFQGSIDEMVRDAELDEIRRDVEKAAGRNFSKDIEKQLDPDGALAGQAAWLQDDMDRVVRDGPRPPPPPGVSPAEVFEPADAADAAAGPATAPAASARRPSNGNPAPPLDPPAPKTDG